MPKQIISEVPNVKSTNQMVDSRQAKYGKKKSPKEEQEETINHQIVWAIW